MRARIDGLLLAGGRSRRFGSDKRRAVFGTRTMAAGALALLRGAVDGDLFVAGSGAFERPVDAVFLEDAARGRGPLGGLVSALGHSRFGVLVIPCDAPLLRGDTLAAVARLGRRHGRTVVVRSRRGLEPLVAFYPRTARPVLAAGLREGTLALHRLLGRLAPLEVQAFDGRELQNVNTTRDLEAALGFVRAGSTARDAQGRRST